MSRLYDRAFLDDLAKRLGEYLEMTGRSTKNNFSCVSPDHEDNNPSMHFYGTTCFCFACGARYDIFKFVGVDFGINDFRSQVEKVCKLFRVSSKNAVEMTKDIRAAQQEKAPSEKTLKNYNRFFGYCRSHIQDTDYWKKRGFSEAIVKKAKLGFHPSFKIDKKGTTWPVLVLPIDKNHYVMRNTDEYADKNDRYRVSHSGRVLYTRFSDLQNSMNPTWIVEGELDAISLADVGAEAIALGSTQNISKLLKYLDANKPKAPLILSFDNDKSGRDAQEELVEGLKKIGIPFWCARISGYKDANEFLQDDRRRFELYVKHNIMTSMFSFQRDGR